MVSAIGLGMGALDFGGYRLRGRGSLGGEFVASHCNQWGLCCVVVWNCVVIELSFGVVSRVGPGIHVLDGSPRASRGRAVFENTYFTFFSDFKKHDFLRFFEMTYEKVVKSR